MKKSAFTLAEIMIVLTVIGILTGILMPIAFHSAPDEDVMKFKKAHNTFTTAIRELVNSDKYYLDGDLGVRPDGTLIDGSHSGDKSYFCNTIADLVNANKSDCNAEDKDSGSDYATGPIKDSSDCSSSASEKAFWDNLKVKLDSRCLRECSNRSFIELQGNIVFYESASRSPFGMTFGKQLEVAMESGTSCQDVHGAASCADLRRHYSAATNEITHPDCNGFDRVYKLFCIDIDETCTGEPPFGYGVRADGKILLGARAQEWLEKSVQKGE